MPPTLTIDCAVCGGRFTAKRHTAKYCSPRCRMRASRAPEKPPLRQESAPIVALAPKASGDTGLLMVTLNALEQADRVDTPMGQATILIARLLDSGIQDTGSSIAALIRQYDASLTKALDGAQRVESPLERGRRARELRVG